MKTKHCNKCNSNKFISEFSKNKTKHDGLCSTCKLCHKQEAKDWYIKNRDRHVNNIRKWTIQHESIVRTFLMDYLSKHDCVDCHENNALALQFDHKNRKLKEFNISECMRGGYSLDKIKNEISKCDVRCANCHSIKTAHETGCWKLKFLP